MNTFNKRSRIRRPCFKRDPKTGAKHLAGLALSLLGLTSWLLLPSYASSRPSRSAFAHRTNPSTKSGQSGFGVDSTSSATGQIGPLGLNAWSSNGPAGTIIYSLAMDHGALR